MQVLPGGQHPHGQFDVQVALLLCFGLSNRFEKESVWVAMAVIGLGVCYIVFGPLFVKGVQVHKAWKEQRLQNGQNQGDDSSSDVTGK